MKKFIILLVVVVSIVSSALTALATNFLVDHGILDRFPDVFEGSYYYDAVYDLGYYGVMSGYENGNFGPNDPVTRGQLAAILHRYDNKFDTGLVRADNNFDQADFNGVDNLKLVVCAGLTELDMANNPELGASTALVQYNQELYRSLCHFE